MVLIKVTAQEKRTWKHSKYGIPANGLTEDELAETETETEKTPVAPGLRFLQLKL